MWAVFNKNKSPITIAHHKGTAINAILDVCPSGYSWDDFKKRGYTVEKVTVTKGWGNE